MSFNANSYNYICLAAKARMLKNVIQKFSQDMKFLIQWVLNFNGFNVSNLHLTILALVNIDSTQAPQKISNH